MINEGIVFMITIIGCLNKLEIIMSEYKWCHGPKCHKSHTQDRIRGSKGSKVLRTKKVKTTEWNRD